MKLIITDLENFSIPVAGKYRVIGPDHEIHPCTGCFGCWVRSPGECVIKDDARELGALLGGSDELIFVSRCCWGGLSPFVKTVLDRCLSYVHPDFELRGGEMHHRRRYQNVLTLSAYYYGSGITPEEQETARALLLANAENMDGRAGRCEFFEDAGEMEGVTL